MDPKTVLPDIPRKIVAGSRGVVVELIGNVHSVNIVDKTIQGAVSAA